jgi:hypothetical protein
MFFATSDASWDVFAVTLSVPVRQTAVALRWVFTWMRFFDNNFCVQKILDFV